MRLLKVLNGVPCGVRLIGNERRTAKKALKEARKRGARCIVRTMNGETVSACEYSDEFGFYYICA